MTKIIGVNHFMTLEGYSIRFSYPWLTNDMTYELDGAVGLELLPPSERKSLNDIFWKNNPSNILSVFNPEAHKYFEDLEKVCGKMLYLDSAEITEKIIALDEKNRTLVKEINSGFKVKDDFSDGETIIDYQGLSKVLLDHRKAYLEAIRTDFERDTIMLERILEHNLDTAVVGMGHARNWMNSRKYDFEFLGEDVFNNISLSSLSNALSVHDFKPHDIVETWAIQLLDKNRSKQPDFIGLFDPFTPDTYFEVFMDAGKNTGECFDSYGKSLITMSINGESFSMDKKYIYHIQGKPINFNYSGTIIEDKILGSINGYGEFIMVKNNIDALKTFENLYSDEVLLEKLVFQNKFSGIGIKERYFPFGVGNITKPANIGDDIPF